jgi:hypothetical protein
MRCPTAQAGRAGQPPPARISNSVGSAFCCDGGSCSPTALRSSSARAFDLLLVLLEADGALVAKEELFSRVWPSVVVSEENVKFQIAALRKALGADRDVIHTEVGRGYRFIGVLRVNGGRAALDGLAGEELRAVPTPSSPKIPGSTSEIAWWPHSCPRSFRSVNSAACTERCRFSGLNTVRGSTAWA